MDGLFIEARRECYVPSQVFETMTVGQLIAFLGDYDEDTPVYLRHDNGYTYGGITEDCFNVRDMEKEEE